MPKADRLLLCVALWIFFSWTLCTANDAQANDTVSGDLGSVGIISSVSGEARITRSADPQEANQPKFRGPIIYGDRISTSKDSTVGLLVGQNSLLTLQEFSDVRIAEAASNRQILQMVSGRACLAASQSASSTTEPLRLRTPTAIVTVAPGTLLHVDVTAASKESVLPSGADGERRILTSAQVAERATAPVVETYQVIEGSVDIVSLASSASPTSLRTGQSLRVAGGVIGRPFVAAPVNCRSQSVQIIPPHTTTPKAAQQSIVQAIRQTASQTASINTVKTVAAMTQSSGGTGSSTTIPTGVILSTTPTSINPTTAHTSISVKLP